MPIIQDPGVVLCQDEGCKCDLSPTTVKKEILQASHSGLECDLPIVTGNLPFHLPFPTAKFKKTTKKSPKTSNFPQVDSSTLIVRPIICAFFLRKKPDHLGQLANRPVPPSPLSTKDIKPFLFDGWIPFTKTSWWLWPLSFPVENVFLLLKMIYVKWMDLPVVHGFFRQFFGCKAA